MKNSKISPTDLTDQPSARRRAFLRRSMAAAACAPAAVSLLGSGSALAKSTNSGRVPMVDASAASPQQGEVARMERNASRRLHLLNEHTGDNINVVYYTHGIFINDSLSKLNHLMRDRRMNLARQMDTTLYDLLFLIQSELGTSEPVHILSGYRTPETNAKLRRRLPKVAKKSLHIEGRAADIYVPGLPVQQVHEAALSFKAGGVGLYSKSNFVHIDTGVVRHWGS